MLTTNLVRKKVMIMIHALAKATDTFLDTSLTKTIAKIRSSHDEQTLSTQRSIAARKATVISTWTTHQKDR